MSEPITTALRRLLCARPLGDPCWDAMDAVDAVHAALEAENAALRERVGELDNAGGSMHDGGSITGELREWWVRKFPVMDKELHKDFTAIADRIDAEHESACAEAYGNGVMSVPIALDESQWVKLPLDADGVPIRFGDKVTVPWSEKVYEVSGFSCTQQLESGERTIWVDVYSLEKPGNIPLCGVSSCHHYHAPTVEDVLREFGRGWHELMNAPETFDIADYVERYAAKLRLAGDAE